VTSTPGLRIGGRTFAWGSRTYVMGIVNVTPDSFSGDGLLAAGDPVAAAVHQARDMVEEGADLLDVGGESTRPGHAEVTEQAELERVVPVVAAIADALPGVPVSVDTTKARVAEEAIAAGAMVVNDVWGVRSDPDILEVVVRHRVPYILMHNRDEPRYDDVVEEVATDLEAAIRRAILAGVASERIIVDPGIGFGKTAEQNLVVLRELGALRRLGHPILLGTSRKSTIGKVLGLPPDQRLEGTLATTVLGIAAGADIVRVHDVRPNLRAARMADAIIRGTWHETPAAEA
jgi:dihydropteroate synthase